MEWASNNNHICINIRTYKVTQVVTAPMLGTWRKQSRKKTSKSTDKVWLWVRGLRFSSSCYNCQFFTTDMREARSLMRQHMNKHHVHLLYCLCISPTLDENIVHTTFWASHRIEGAQHRPSLCAYRTKVLKRARIKLIIIQASSNKNKYSGGNKSV